MALISVVKEQKKEGLMWKRIKDQQVAARSIKLMSRQQLIRSWSTKSFLVASAAAATV